MRLFFSCESSTTDTQKDGSQNHYGSFPHYFCFTCEVIDDWVDGGGYKDTFVSRVEIDNIGFSAQSPKPISKCVVSFPRMEKVLRQEAISCIKPLEN